MRLQTSPTDHRGVSRTTQGTTYRDCVTRPRNQSVMGVGSGTKTWPLRVWGIKVWVWVNLNECKGKGKGGGWGVGVGYWV